MHALSALLSMVGASVLLATSASADTASPAHFMHRRATAVTPSSPGPGDKFNEGSQCTLQWTPGSGRIWTSMTIKLMTGANQAMTELTDVATGIDGTTLSSFSWTCPDVEPNSAIYFYQFTDSNDAHPTWTTRFTIAGANGETTEPTESKQPEGEDIPWGTGALATSSSSGNSSSSSSSSSSTDESSLSPNTTSTPSSSSSTDSSPTEPQQTTQQTSQQTTEQSSSTNTSGASSIQVGRAVCLGVAALAVAAIVA